LAALKVADEAMGDFETWHPRIRRGPEWRRFRYAQAWAEQQVCTLRALTRPGCSEKEQVLWEAEWKRLERERDGLNRTL
jgi:hypothetical protein